MGGAGTYVCGEHVARPPRNSRPALPSPLLPSDSFRLGELSISRGEPGEGWGALTQVPSTCSCWVKQGSLVGIGGTCPWEWLPWSPDWSREMKRASLHLSFCFRNQCR